MGILSNQSDYLIKKKTEIIESVFEFSVTGKSTTAGVTTPCPEKYKLDIKLSGF